MNCIIEFIVKLCGIDKVENNDFSILKRQAPLIIVSIKYDTFICMNCKQFLLS